MLEVIMKNFIKGCGFFFLGIIFFFPGNVFAEIGLSVAPQKYEMTVFPGDSYAGQFKVHNPSAIALPIDLRVIPFGAQDETGDIIFGESGAPENPVSWMNLEERNFLLAPKENRRIPFEIIVPRTAPEGGYYMIVQFQLRIPDFERQRHGARTVPSVGIPILIATTELALDSSPPREDLMEITSFGVVPQNRVGFVENILRLGSQTLFARDAFAEERSGAKNNEIGLQIVRGEPDHFVLLIKNNDIFHFQPKGVLTVYDSLNREVVKKEIDEQTVLPGMSRRFELKKETEEVGSFNLSLADIFTNFMVGRYRAELNLTGQGPVHTEITPRGDALSLSIFSIVPFIFWITLLTLAVLIFLGRKRIKMAKEALFKS